MIGPRFRQGAVLALALLAVTGEASSAQARPTRPTTHKATPVAAPSVPLTALPTAPTLAGKPLSLGEAVGMARNFSLGTQASQERLKAVNVQRQATVDSSWLTFGMEVSANYNQLPSDSPLLAFVSAPGGGGIVGFPAPGAYVDSSFRANQILFDGFRLRDGLIIADDQIALGRLGVTQAQEDAMTNAAIAYFGVLRADGLAQVAASSVQQAQEHLRLGNERLKNGAGTRADVLNLRAQLAQSQGSLIQARNGVNTARLQLDRALNRPTTDRPLDANAQVAPVTLDVDREITAGLTRRTEVQQAILKQHLDLNRVSLAGRAYYPTVQANSTWAQRGLYQGQFGAAVVLDWAIFDGFKTRDQIAAAQSDVDADAVALDTVRQDLTLEVRTQSQARQEASDRLVIAREGLTAADEAYRISIQRYSLGFSTSTELLDARTTLAQARNTYIQAQYDLNVAQVRLAKALGLDMGGYLSAR